MKSELIVGEGKTPLQAEADYEMKKQAIKDDYPDAYFSHKTVYQKHGRHQVVQYVVLEQDRSDATDSVLTKKVKRKGF